MECISALSAKFTPPSAAEEVIKAIQENTKGSCPDLLLLFISGHSLFGQQAIQGMVREAFPGVALLGCSSGGVLCGQKAIVEAPGIVLSALWTQGEALRPFHVRQEDLPGLDGSAKPWKDLIPGPNQFGGSFLILSHPATMRTETLLSGLNYAFPGSECFGGLASVANTLGQINLYCDDEHYHHGAVGIYLGENVKVHRMVGQGYRGVGKMGHITECSGRRIVEIDDMPALDFLQETYSRLEAELKRRSDFSLMAGLVENEMVDSPDDRDFLIRNIVELDARGGSISITSDCRPGQRIRFQMRDPDGLRSSLQSQWTSLNGRAAKLKGGIWVHSLGFSGDWLSDKAPTSTFESMPGMAGFLGWGEICTKNGRSFVNELTSCLSCFF